MREPHGDFVGTDAAAAKLNELRSRPGMADEVAKIRAEMAGPGRKRRTLQEIIDNQEELAARFYAWGEDEPDDTDMTSADFKAAMARGIPCEIVTSREECLRRLEET